MESLVFTYGGKVLDTTLQQAEKALGYKFTYAYGEPIKNEEVKAVYITESGTTAEVVLKKYTYQFDKNGKLRWRGNYSNDTFVEWR